MEQGEGVLIRSSIRKPITLHSFRMDLGHPHGEALVSHLRYRYHYFPALTPVRVLLIPKQSLVIVCHVHIHLPVYTHVPLL